MARIICLDVGGKRTGIAVTDPLQLIATGLTTVPTPQLFAYLKTYLEQETVERFLVGMPLNLDGTETHGTALAREVLLKLTKQFPGVPAEPVDERYSSREASRAMIDMGLPKKKRREKALVDRIAATILLQEYLRNRPSRGDLPPLP